MGETRVLTRRDERAARRLLDADLVANISVAARVYTHGVERARLGNDVVGFFERGRLVSLLSDGYALHPVAATPAALDAFAQRGERRRCGSIVGPRDQAIGLWQRLTGLNYAAWASPRSVRDHQPVMVIRATPRVRPDPRVAPAPTRWLDAYHTAAVAMYTEEVGVAPMDPQGSYRTHVAGLMMKGLAYAVIEADRVVFKADVVAEAGGVGQLGGVWLTPEWRGHGLSESLVAAVVASCLARYDTITLYVNPYNHPAVHCYERVGFRQVGEYATVLY